MKNWGTHYNITSYFLQQYSCNNKVICLKLKIILSLLALDGASVYSSLYSTLDPVCTMKTRSLPLWGRSRPRPLSTEDDLNELYAKVNLLL